MFSGGDGVRGFWGFGRFFLIGLIPIYSLGSTRDTNVLIDKESLGKQVVQVHLPMLLDLLIGPIAEHHPLVVPNTSSDVIVSHELPEL